MCRKLFVATLFRVQCRVHKPLRVARHSVRGIAVLSAKEEPRFSLLKLDRWTPCVLHLRPVLRRGVRSPLLLLTLLSDPFGQRLPGRLRHVHAALFYEHAAQFLLKVNRKLDHQEIAFLRCFLCLCHLVKAPFCFGYKVLGARSLDLAAGLRKLPHGDFMLAMVAFRLRTSSSRSSKVNGFDADECSVSANGSGGAGSIG